MQIGSVTRSGTLGLSIRSADETVRTGCWVRLVLHQIWPVHKLVGYCCPVPCGGFAVNVRFVRPPHGRLDCFGHGGQGVELSPVGHASISLAKEALTTGKTVGRVAQAIAKGNPEHLGGTCVFFAGTHLVADIKQLEGDVLRSVLARFCNIPANQTMRHLWAGGSHLTTGILPVEEATASTRTFREDLFAVVPASRPLTQKSRVVVADMADQAVTYASGAIARLFTNDLCFVLNITHKAQISNWSLGLTHKWLGITSVMNSCGLFDWRWLTIPACEQTQEARARHDRIVSGAVRQQPARPRSGPKRQVP